MTPNQVGFPIRGIYEVAVQVKDLDKSQTFYCTALGLDEGLRVDDRGMRFLCAGGERGMLVLIQSNDEVPTQHFAFAIDEADIDETIARLDEAGIDHSDPVFQEWMPGTSIYFRDPDGHDAEFFAPGSASAGRS